MSFLGDYVPAHGGFEDDRRDIAAYAIGGYDLRSNGGYTEKNFHIIKGEDIPCEEADCNPSAWSSLSPGEELRERFQELLLADVEWLKSRYKKKYRARHSEGLNMANDIQVKARYDKTTINNILYSDFLVVSEGEKGY